MPDDITDYSNTVFYKIFCNDATVNDLYVGHTTNFVQRKYAHKKTCTKENYPNHHLKVYKCIREHGGWDNWKMKIIGYKDCSDHYEARTVEQTYFEALHATLNSIEPLPKPKPRPTTVPKVKRVWQCDVCNTTCNTNNDLIAHGETKKHKRNVISNTSSNNNGEPKNSPNFSCEKCNYGCSSKFNYNRHTMTAKHKMLTNAYTNEQRLTAYLCDCGRSYKHRQSFYRHKKGAKHDEPKHDEPKNNEPKNEIILTNNKDQLIFDLLTQNKELISILNKTVPKIGNNNTSNNNQFNIQLFLNE